MSPAVTFETSAFSTTTSIKMFDIIQRRFCAQILFTLWSRIFDVSYAGVRYFSSYRTVKYLQFVNKFHVKVIHIFGVTVDTISAANSRSFNFQFRIADDTFNGNFYQYYSVT